MRLARTTRQRSVAVLAASAAVLALVAIEQPASAASARHAIADSLPAWTAKAAPAGAPAPSSTVSFGVLLPLRNQSAAEALLQSISTPGSAKYRSFLSNAQFNAQFAPAKTDVRAISTWLSSQGFAVSKTLPSGMYVEARGTAAQVEKTFATTLKTFSYQGQKVRANVAQLSLPANAPAQVVGAIKGVLGIDQGAQLHKPADTLPGPPAGSRYGVQPCSAYYGQKIAYDKPSAYGQKAPYEVCGYTGKQLESGYGLTPLIKAGLDGRGVTVAVVDAYAAPTILADANTYSAKHGIPTFKPGQFDQITPAADGYDLEGPDDCDAQGWYGEETLDVEAVHSMAPGAHVTYVGGTDCVSGLDEAWAESIDNHVADIITNSWGDDVDDLVDLGLDYVEYYLQFSLEAALTGITVNFSSGDDGDQTAGGTDLASKTADFPADLPYITSVGGTSVAIGKHGNWIGEHGWQSAYSVLTNGAWTPAPPGKYSAGGGGGTSQLFAQPFYQKGKVPASVSQYYGGAPARAIPDIAMDADSNTGMLIGETQEFPDGTYYDEYRLGGTSLSSPLFAGVMAIADQLACGSLGFANPLYYRLISTPAVHDVSAPKSPIAEVRTDYANFLDASEGYTYKLRTVDVQTSTLHDTPGWDDETGVGSPNGPKFFLGLLLASGIHARSAVPTG